MSGVVYYFKVEPIGWQILSTDGDTALILCDSIIANHRYDNSSNNYKDSEIREWLNEQFYETAFDELQREIILTTTVDNSAASTGYTDSNGNPYNPYACEDTKDKIFLLSYTELKTYLTTTTAREKKTTDYTKSQGAYTDTDSYSGEWWLRSPYNGSSYGALCVYSDGHVGIGSYVSGSGNGVVPALQIQL